MASDTHDLFTMDNNQIEMESVVTDASGENSEMCEVKETDKISNPFTDNEEVQDILTTLENCPTVFKSQQKDEPELGASDKRKIAEELLKTNPLGFFYRFGPYLTEKHLGSLKCLYTNSSEVDYCIKKLEETLKLKNSKVKNRRFEALQRLKLEGKYFSHLEMQEREPLLYYQMVGQFLSDKEKYKNRREQTDDYIPTFSSYLIDQMETEHIQNIEDMQRLEEEMDHLGGSDGETEEIHQESRSQCKRWGDDWEDGENEIKLVKKIKKLTAQSKEVTKEEQALLLDEFISHMHTRFLNGLDADFDYSVVDSNPEYDCLTVRTQDEEEKYFDEETCDINSCTDTGIEDY